MVWVHFVQIFIEVFQFIQFILQVIIRLLSVLHIVESVLKPVYFVLYAVIAVGHQVATIELLFKLIDAVLQFVGISVINSIHPFAVNDSPIFGYLRLGVFYFSL